MEIQKRNARAYTYTNLFNGKLYLYFRYRFVIREHITLNYLEILLLKI